MVKRSDKGAWKAAYFCKLLKLLEAYPRCFIVGVDNVGSNQMQQIRSSLRGHAEILMGKNTMIRKVIKGHLQKNPAFEKLLPYVVGNVGFVFTNGDLADVKSRITQHKVAAPAKAGTIAPIDVSLPAQNTGMGPEKTSFFQALNIPTKISRGTIEILNDVHLIKRGEKVGASEATLLQMLNIKPFSYGLTLLQVYDSGTICDPQILDITNEDLIKKVLEGVSNIASLSLAINYPTKCSVPHLLANGFKNLLAVAVQTDISFKEIDKVKEFLADPSKLTAATVVVAQATKEEVKAAKPAVEDKKEESDEEGDFGLSLFD